MNDTRWKIREGLIQAELDDERVVLELDAGMYYGVRAVAARIWEWLASPRSKAELRDLVCEEFEVEAGEAEADVESFLQALHSRALIAEAAG